MNRIIWKSAIALGASLAAILGIGILPAAAEPQNLTRSQVEVQEQIQQQIYGWELMSPEERFHYWQRMQNAETVQERERIRTEHREMILERARQRGVDVMPQPGRGSPQGGMGGGQGGQGNMGNQGNMGGQGAGSGQSQGQQGGGMMGGGQNKRRPMMGR